MPRLDDIGFGGLRLLQNPKAFCYGVDAVLLADFAARYSARPPRAFAPKRARCRADSSLPKRAWRQTDSSLPQGARHLAGAHVDLGAPVCEVAAKPCGFACDLGAGTGVIPLILSHKTDCESIYGIELQAQSFELFERNIALNSMQNRLKAINADILDLADLYPDLKGKFDIVTANPPYVKKGAGIPNSNEEKRLARHESSAGVQEFVQVAANLLSESGALFMIHRPERLADIFDALANCRMHAEILQFVATNEDAAPSMVLIKCVKGNKELAVPKTLYIYNKNRRYTQEINEIYER